jgi:dolichyl-phosphate-mannose--protein O-mannosyl transferase
MVNLAELTGLGLGAVSSCKWLGLSTIATIGLATNSSGTSWET